MLCTSAAEAEQERDERLRQHFNNQQGRLAAETAQERERGVFTPAHCMTTGSAGWQLRWRRRYTLSCAAGCRNAAVDAHQSLLCSLSCYPVLLTVRELLSMP